MIMMMIPCCARTILLENWACAHALNTCAHAQITHEYSRCITCVVIDIYIGCVDPLLCRNKNGNSFRARFIPFLARTKDARTFKRFSNTFPHITKQTNAHTCIRFLSKLHQHNIAYRISLISFSQTSFTLSMHGNARAFSHRTVSVYTRRWHLISYIYIYRAYSNLLITVSSLSLSLSLRNLRAANKGTLDTANIPINDNPSSRQCLAQITHRKFVRGEWEANRT